jgi:hypothetical protein
MELPRHHHRKTPTGVTPLSDPDNSPLDHQHKLQPTVPHRLHAPP